MNAALTGNQLAIDRWEERRERAALVAFFSDSTLNAMDAAASAASERSARAIDEDDSWRFADG